MATGKAVSFETRWDTTIGEGIVAARSGHVVTLSFENCKTTKAYDANETIVTLQDEFKPKYAVSMVDTLQREKRICVTTNGAIYSTSSLANNLSLRGCLTYVTA